MCVYLSLQHFRMKWGLWVLALQPSTATLPDSPALLSQCSPKPATSCSVLPGFSLIGMISPFRVAAESYVLAKHPLCCVWVRGPSPCSPLSQHSVFNTQHLLLAWWVPTMSPRQEAVWGEKSCPSLLTNPHPLQGDQRGAEVGDGWEAACLHCPSCITKMGSQSAGMWPQHYKGRWRCGCPLHFSVRD